jgi:SAM-dependent methyltransferase
VSRCSGCGLVWLDPQPVPEDVAKLYRTYYTHAVAERPPLAGSRDRVRELVLGASFGYSVQGGLVSRAAGRALSGVPPVFDRVAMAVGHLESGARGRLLDIGTGAGEFLARMRALGWEVEGLEPDANAVQTAREHLGLRMHHGTLHDVDLPPASFDAVVSSHVVEHVHDPIDFLSRAWRLVRPGGRLVIITPNVESLAHRRHRSAWYALDPPRHLYLFSVPTFEECARRAGVGPGRVTTSSRLAGHTWSAGQMIRRTRKGPPAQPVTVRARVEGLAFQLLEDSVRLISPHMGEELLLVGRKP